MNLCVFKIKTNINKFAMSSHMAFELNKQALKGYLKLACEYGKNYMKARPPLVPIFNIIVY